MNPMRYCAILLAVVTAAPAAAHAQGLPADPLPIDPDVTVGRFGNGLWYYIRENTEPANRAELRLVVNAGSVLETDAQQGLAHFLEHMAFNGTAHFPKQALVDYLERIGMRFGPEINAYTSFDETVYMLTVPTDSAELLETAFQILEDWAHGIVLDPEEIDRERGVVLEEWRLGRGAQARIRDQQLPVLFRGSRYAERLPIGQPSVIESFVPDTLEDFYRTWYRPDLMAVIAVGDFDAAAVGELVQRHFGTLPGRADAPERPVMAIPDHEETLYAIATDAEATNADVSVYYKHPLRPRGTVGAYRQSMVEALYNRMLNQRLFELTQRPGAPFVVGFSSQGRFARGMEMYTLGALVSADGIARGLTAVLTEAERVARHGFTATELERTSREMLREMEQAFAERENTNSAQLASEYARHFLTDEPIPGIAAEFELAIWILPSVQLDEVNALARTLLTDRNRVVLVSAPESPDVRVPDEEMLGMLFTMVETAAVNPYVDSVAEAPLVDELPAGSPVVREEHIDEVDLTLWELQNGVRVVLKPTDFQDDEVLLQAWSPGGTSLATDEDYVSASAAAAAVEVQGVGAFTMVDLQKQLAGKAVQVGPFVSQLYEGLSGSASPRDLETLFELVYLYVTAPRVDSAAFVAMRQQMQSYLENRNASPQAAFADTLQVTLAQHHPRVRPMTSAVFDEIDLGQSMAFYRDRFADAGDFTFVLVGAFEPDSVRPLVERYLGGLPSTGRDETWRNPGIDPPTGVVERSIYRGVEPSSQTALVFSGTWEDSRANRHVLRSTADVLEIRLREVLREDLGGTYSVSLSATGERFPDPEYAVRIAFGADPERVDELVGVVFAQIDSLQRTGPTADELQRVKEMQRRARETSLEQNGYWLAQLVSYGEHGDDYREILTYEQLIDALTGEAIRQAAQRYLRADTYVRVTLYPESMQ